MGLIARELESRGLPTVCLSSAYSITKSVNPPRAIYLDFPLGRTAGKPNDPALQRRIMIEALDAFATLRQPGEIITLTHRWSDDDGWKDHAMRPKPRSDGRAGDDRVGRFDRPQYQSEADRAAAEANLAAGECPGCVFLREAERGSAT